MALSYQEIRAELACSLRWAARLGFHEGVCNHFSVAVPEADGSVSGEKFLVNPYGWHWSEITASSLVLCNAEGEVIEGEEKVEDTAFFIHSKIHSMVPQAKVVMHTHMPYATSLTLLENGRLEMCEQNALMFDGRIAYDDEYSGLALDGDEGIRMASKLGNRNIMFLASHGVVVIGPSVSQAFTDLYYLERASMFQVKARSTGGRLRVISDNIRQKVKEQFVVDLPLLAERHFSALQRILDKEENEYRS